MFRAGSVSQRRVQQFGGLKDITDPFLAGFQTVDMAILWRNRIGDLAHAGLVARHPMRRKRTNETHSRRWPEQTNGRPHPRIINRDVVGSNDRYQSLGVSTAGSTVKKFTLE
jgi:hypothetical protein